jgi:hypothetical protein
MDLLKKRRVPVEAIENNEQLLAEMPRLEDVSDSEDEENTKVKDVVYVEQLVNEQKKNNINYCYRQAVASGHVPRGATVVLDPIYQYYESLSPNDKPKTVMVAEGSAPLRYVRAEINGAQVMDILVDSGSQFCSMKETVAAALGLHWNPDKTIHMQSASGDITTSQGTAEMVPFRFGEITLYMQVHIFANTSYDVLLGRPWDVLTSSIVENFSDGGGKITLTDPSSGQRCVIPTFDFRTEVPKDEQAKEKQDFQRSSMSWR